MWCGLNYEVKKQKILSLMNSLNKRSVSAFAVMIFCGIFCSSAQSQDTLSKYILTPKQGPAPKINGAKVFGVRPGHPIIFTIPASGLKPIVFSADHLPKGVKVDANTGKISGSIAKAGEYNITLHATNKSGQADRKFKIVVGETISLTPPMGWNSWNIYASKVTQELVLANATAMVSSGLAEHGWSYMNIDDVWQGKRGGDYFAILPDSATFPDMQALCDKVHQLGLKTGIYSTPWVESYGHHIGGSAQNAEGLFVRTKENIPRNKKQFPYALGSYVFWDKDVKQWARWGFDFLKYDWNPIELPETKAMYDLLRASGRDVVFSLSNSTPFASIADLSKLANAWRTGGDIKDSWKSLKSRLLTQDKWAPYARPGHWNDPDMMIVGWVGWGKGPRPTNLTPDEQYAHMSAWCLQSVPLLLGNDLTKLDDFTISLLTNDEVIAVNQDPLGKQATLVSRQDSCGVLAKDMEDGSKAAGLFNLSDSITRKLVVKWSELGIKGKYIIRDLWRQKDLGVFEDEFSAMVNPHGVVMVSLRKLK
jgi:alpha-galactosidase